MLAKNILSLASCSVISFRAASAVAAPLTQPDDLSAKQYIDNPRFGGRDAAPIVNSDDTDSVRITGGVGPDKETDWGRVKERDRLSDKDGFVLIKIRDDGPDKETDWGKVKRGDEGPEDRNE